MAGLVYTRQEYTRLFFNNEPKIGAPVSWRINCLPQPCTVAQTQGQTLLSIGVWGDEENIKNHIPSIVAHRSSLNKEPPVGCSSLPPSRSSSLVTPIYQCGILPLKDNTSRISWLSRRTCGCAFIADDRGGCISRLQPSDHHLCFLSRCRRFPLLRLSARVKKNARNDWWSARVRIGEEITSRKFAGGGGSNTGWQKFWRKLEELLDEIFLIPSLK